MLLTACARQLIACADAAEALSVRASAAPNLANAPHDGPDEPLLLRYDPGGGAPSFLCSSYNCTIHSKVTLPCCNIALAAGW